MTSAQTRRAGPLGRTWLAAVVWVGCLCTAPAVAQAPGDTLPSDTARIDRPSTTVAPADTIPADTAAADTLLVPIPAGGVAPDTLPADSLAADSLAAEDSLVAVPVFPRFADERPTGWAYARWEWDRDELLRFHGLSVLDLLARVPGIVITRSGDFGSPAGISALGLGGARVRIFLDGFELDPLGFTTVDPQQIGLVDLEEVRVQRGPNEIRVDLTPVRMANPHPYSVLEAGTGVYDIKLLRGLLMRGIGSHSIVTGAYDLVSTRGFGFDLPYALSDARLSWSYALGEKTALQVEYRGTSTERSRSGYPLDAAKRLFVLRGRSEVTPGLTLDAMVGRTTRSPEEDDPLGASLSSTQSVLRAGYDFGAGWAEASVRARNGSLESTAAPGFEFRGAGSMQLLPWLNAGAELTEASLGGRTDPRWSTTLRTGYSSGLAAYATVGGGRQSLGLVRDTAIEVVDPDATGDEDEGEPGDSIIQPRYSVAPTGIGMTRFGAEWIRGGARIGAAAILADGGSMAPFGFAFDRTLAPVEVGSARGLEASADLPVPLTRDAVHLEGWYSFWSERGGRPYLPEEYGRLSLVYHDLYYDDELEPTLRIELEHRGNALAPAADGSGFTVTTPPFSLLNLSLEIRILDLRAFFVWNNVLDNRGALVIPGQRPPGTRMYYGVRWIFHD